MKILILNVFKFLAVFFCLSGFHSELISKGFVNVIVLLVWCESFFIIVGALCALSSDTFLKRILTKSKKAKIIGKISRAIMRSIGLVFIFYSYWFTGVIYLVAAFMVDIVRLKIAGKQTHE
ncbi:hypothetical protein VXS06_09180 [Photobacterium toruni]|uniref:ATP synthase I chain n=1 Tax=Photobacterium toruni TaxID=1935446 RepID=A0ABU6L7D3_9GAMM|nr:hypothetical protein [Photobacterium toruni]